jgi:hypothetical protein
VHEACIETSKNRKDRNTGRLRKIEQPLESIKKYLPKIEDEVRKQASDM